MPGVSLSAILMVIGTQISIAATYNISLELDKPEAINAFVSTKLKVISIRIYSDYDSCQKLNEDFKYHLILKAFNYGAYTAFTTDDMDKLMISCDSNAPMMDTANRPYFLAYVKFTEVKEDDFGEYSLCVCPNWVPATNQPPDRHDCHPDCKSLSFLFQDEKFFTCLTDPIPSCSFNVLGYSSVMPHSEDIHAKISSMVKFLNDVTVRSPSMVGLVSNLSDGCRILLQTAPCVITFPKCKYIDDQKEKGIELTQLCKRECLDMFDLCHNWENMLKKYQNHEFIANMSTILQSLKLGSTFGRELCSNFEDANCLSINASTLKTKVTGISNGTVALTSTCYNESDQGSSYRGTHSSTRGRLCLFWRQSREYSALSRHSPDTIPYAELYQSKNYCRNPVNVSTGARKVMPWCFVSSTEWDFCPLDECSDDGRENSTLDQALQSLLTKRMLFIFLSAAILLCMFCCILFFCFHWSCRRQKDLPEDVMFKEPKLITYASKDETGMMRFDRSRIEIISKIGQGEFGIVHKAAITENDTAQFYVAVKALRMEASNSERNQFRKEAELMKRFKHDNIVEFRGVCFEGDPLYMIFEFMPDGDLHEYLINLQPELNNVDEREVSHLISMQVEKHLSQFLNISIQIAKGLAYLAQKSFVHRDIAARNVLLSKGKDGFLTVKLSDFGLSRSVFTKNYYRMRSKSLLPVRWMPPEAITYATFTAASDVYSFGVVLWEIFSFGAQPYESISNEDVVTHILKPEILKQPIGCPATMYEIMMQCWNYQSKLRPKAEELIEKLQQEETREFRMPRSIHRAQTPHHNYNNISDISRPQNRQLETKSPMSPNGNADFFTKTRFPGSANPTLKSSQQSFTRPRQFPPRLNPQMSNMPVNAPPRASNRPNNFGTAWRGNTGTFPPHPQYPGAGPVDTYNMSDLGKSRLPSQKTQSFDMGPRLPHLAASGFPNTHPPNRPPMQYSQGPPSGRFPVGARVKFPNSGAVNSAKNNSNKPHLLMNSNRSMDHLNNFSPC